jgi:hypothetical protein
MKYVSGMNRFNTPAISMRLFPSAPSPWSNIINFFGFFPLRGLSSGPVSIDLINGFCLIQEIITSREHLSSKFFCMKKIYRVSIKNI